jgi:hypothetical protein
MRLRKKASLASRWVSKLPQGALFLEDPTSLESSKKSIQHWSEKLAVFDLKDTPLRKISSYLEKERARKKMGPRVKT